MLKAEPKVDPLWVRGLHRYSFRSMEWALVLDAFMVTPDYGPRRPCLQVRFEDGVTDYWPVWDEPQHYEFGNAVDAATKTDKVARF